MTDHAEVRTVEVTSQTLEDIHLEGKAKQVAEILSTTYPNYPWMVGWAPGSVLIVKLMIANVNCGYTIDEAKAYSASMLRREAIMAGGELLERLGMKRGAWNGEMPTQNYVGTPKGHEVPIIMDINNSAVGW